MRNKKLLIGILIIGIVIVSGWWVWNHYRTPICFVLEWQIAGKIERANYCNADEDCITVNFSCPFGCGSYVNRNIDTSSIEERINSYNELCGTCIEKCAILLGSPVCINNKCALRQSTPAVTITTDKTKYKRGETVKITIKNNSTKAIMPSNILGYGIERFEEGNWIDIPTTSCHCPGVKCELAPVSDLQPGEVSEIKWHQGEGICGEEKPTRQAPAGKYRAVIKYKTIIYNGEISYSKNEEISYSNEFTINLTPFF